MILFYIIGYILISYPLKNFTLVYLDNIMTDYSNIINELRCIFNKYLESDLDNVNFPTDSNIKYTKNILYFILGLILILIYSANSDPNAIIAGISLALSFGNINTIIDLNKTYTSILKISITYIRSAKELNLIMFTKSKDEYDNTMNVVDILINDISKICRDVAIFRWILIFISLLLFIVAMYSLFTYL